ncbi:oxidoreductase [Candidatus Woesearchaeota archaeon]|nr:oxidoreductase [Candidatus Woesearchaeota archaeon]
MGKPKVAIHSITGCAGCQLTIYFIEDVLLDLLSKIDLVAAPMIQEKNSKGPYDVTFLEGSVSSQEDLLRVKELREKSKVLVALGTCSSYGNIQSTLSYHKNQKDIPKGIYKTTSHLKSVESSSVDKHVKVDYYIPGCPPDKTEIATFIKDLLLGKTPKAYSKPVCFICNLKENICLLDVGKECLGPVVNGACGALCPSNNHACTGCRGPLDDLNYAAHKEIAKSKGVSGELFKQRIIKYAPKKFEELVKKL